MSSRWAPARAFAERYLGVVSGILGIAASATFAFDGWLAIGVGLTVVAIVSALGFVALDVARRRHLAGEGEALLALVDQSKTLSGVLAASAKAMDATHPWRLSLYHLTPGGWQRVARRASDPTHDHGLGRLILPSGDGFLGRANKSTRVDGLPELPDPRTEWDEYVRLHAELHVHIDVVNGLRMRSRSYAVVIREVGVGPHADAVIGIVAESEVPHGANLQALERMATTEYLTMLFALSKVGDEVVSAANRWLPVKSKI